MDAKNDKHPAPFGVIAGFLSILLSCTVLIGWHTHQTQLVQILPTFVTMQYNTALGFFFRSRTGFG
ncbi:MAG: ascorbate-specific PTS system EIIC-type component UlaA [Gammaproteobacteria bacterium]|jgi:ascorbate-specific PTS system EIIC-type component UlaA